MEAGNILSADVLDIIFDSRNKAYGAYDLRKYYRQRLLKSVAITFLLAVLVSTAYALLGAEHYETRQTTGGGVLVLEQVKPQEKLPMVVPPTRPPELPKLSMVRNMVPIIVKEDIADDTRVPEQTAMDNAVIGNTNFHGLDDNGIVAAPVDPQKGVVTSPAKSTGEPDEFVPIEAESQYPGGLSAWASFLGHHLNYPQAAVDNRIQGTVIIQFVVDAAGNVSDVMAVSGPDELRSAAVSVIKQSGKWTPALQNGRHVKSLKKQPVTFRLEEEQ